ncbi:hypothetical protein GCM10009603_63570 [Nocardiopsis exhalans]
MAEASDFQVVNDMGGMGNGKALTPFQARAWEWALERERETGKLPMGAQITECFYCEERWGRLVKECGLRAWEGTPKKFSSALAERQ